MVVNTYIKTLNSIHGKEVVKHLIDLGYPNPKQFIGSDANYYYGINRKGNIDVYRNLPKDAKQIYILEDFLQNSSEWWW